MLEFFTSKISYIPVPIVPVLNWFKKRREDKELDHHKKYEEIILENPDRKQDE